MHLLLPTPFRRGRLFRRNRRRLSVRRLPELAVGVVSPRKQESGVDEGHGMVVTCSDLLHGEGPQGVHNVRLSSVLKITET